MFYPLNYAGKWSEESNGIEPSPGVAKWPSVRGLLLTNERYSPFVTALVSTAHQSQLRKLQAF